MSDRPRIFFATFANARARQLLERKSNWLQKQLPRGIKWVKPENYHITFKFLGETDREVVEDIKDGFTDITLDIKEGSYKYQGLEAFPHPENPRVIVTPVELGKKELQKVQEVVEEVTGELGFEPDDRTFKPHLTLGRVKNDGLKDEVAQFFDELEDSYVINVLDHLEKISLIESNLTPEGPQYVEIFSRKIK
ncbi:RNA 2',3'-cyclic phosphodiesterase [Halarsenatibacter silvermanii]|uniref:RNA 2',3'-cyclic phosphodiesterase n=1 Tax=Halarsenatibacter silvermanii TaxID=321763 RepID=A0A1G9LMQ1_9FIRM|nr:RNA 2',3'-cyclic phosphodiesterase [Halarsenatibacter silvermanii]SDL63134.1 2'-5' RNA ligase [Halarsenatibacter silvermanii]